MTDLKEKIISIYEEKIKKIDSDIAKEKESILTIKSTVNDLENEKSKLSKECTEILKSVDENKKLNVKASFHIEKNDWPNLTEEDIGKINDWILKHELSYHMKSLLATGEYKYQGAISCAKYEIHKGWTSIGAYVDLVCTECADKMGKHEYENYVCPIQEL